MTLPIPFQVLYAGLAGCLLALIVAAATNGWSLRVFLLLALRLAIGWHFLFEGLHKIHSHHVGPTETSRPFTSEPYFAAAEGPFGEYMRAKYLGDPREVIAAKVTPEKDVPPAEFEKLSPAEQAALCPAAAAKELDAIPEEPLRQAAKATYARWVYGVDARDANVKFVSGGKTALTVPARKAILEVLRKQVRDVEARDAAGLGNGYGIDVGKARQARADLRQAESDLASDAEAFLAQMRADGKAPAPVKPPRDIEAMDKLSMYVITAVGACLIAGLFTPVACVVGFGFLALTYLTHPPFPWYPLPPNTEGNPLFVNKNVIEALALLVIAAHPTGRWLGLDSVLCWMTSGLYRLVTGK